MGFASAFRRGDFPGCTDNANVANIDQENFSLAAKLSHEWAAGKTSVKLGYAKFIDEREDIGEYICGLSADQPLDEKEIRAGYERFKAEKKAQALTDIATRHGVDAVLLQAFVDTVLRRRIFDGDGLSDLMAPLELGWKARTVAPAACGQ